MLGATGATGMRLLAWLALLRLARLLLLTVVGVAELPVVLRPLGLDLILGRPGSPRHLGLRLRLLLASSWSLCRCK